MTRIGGWTAGATVKVVDAGASTSTGVDGTCVGVSEYGVV